MLRRLIAEDADEIALVVCQPDRPQGRGRKVSAPPVKTVALETGIDVVQPTRLKDEALAARLRAHQVDLALVVAYGRILPKAVFEAPTFHTWNVHASLLPYHRGAAPIQHAILAGDAETGVTLMQLSEGMDEGDMLLIRRIPLDAHETAGTLTTRLAALGAEILVEGIAMAKTGGLTRVPQENDKATYAPRIEKIEGDLDLNQSAANLARRVRAFSPWPGTSIAFGEADRLKILRAEVTSISFPSAEPGQIVSLNPFVVQTGDGQLLLTEVQPPGKRPMDAASFLHGAGRYLHIGTPLSAC